MDKQKVKKITFIILLAAIVILTFLLFPFFKALSSPEGMAAFEKAVEGYRIFGVLLVLGIQILQIVVAVIPGEIVEFISGAMYGVIGGTVICLVGVVIGQWIVFKIVRVLGQPLLTSMFSMEKINRYQFLHNSSQLKTIVFFLYFIPGTPKDLLCYLLPITPIKIRDFLVISTLARIVSVVTSTYAGSTFAQGNWKLTAIAYLVIGAISVLGIWIHHKFFRKEDGKKAAPPKKKNRK